MPRSLNIDLCINDSNLWNKFAMTHHFVIEALFPKMIDQTTIITNSIDNADYIYVDVFPTFTILNYLSSSQKCELALQYIDIMNKTGLINRENIFMIKAFPFNEFLFEHLIGIEATYDITDDNQMIIPYYSNFNEIPYDSISPNNRTYSLFLAASYRRKRVEIFDAMKEIPNSKPILLDRENEANLSELNRQTPLLMSHSKFCIIPTGDSPSSKRLYDAIMHGCVPVIISDDLEFPFSKQFDWDKAIVKIPEAQIGQMKNIIMHITDAEYHSLFQNLMDLRELVRFDKGSTPENGVGSILWDLYYYGLEHQNEKHMIHEKQKQRLINSIPNLQKCARGE